MQDFQSYIVRKKLGDASFNFIVGDEVAQLWYDTPNTDPISKAEASSRGFVPSRDGHISWTEMRVLRDHIALPGTKLIECGCHHGFTTIALSAWVGSTGFVHSFDAVLKNASIASENMAINGIENVCVCCAAIGGEFGMAQMYNELNVIVKKNGASAPRSTVMVRLSALFDEPPDALKLDIEGHELGVIESDTDWIARIPRLAIELHTDLLEPGAAKRVVTALGDRPIHVLPENGELRRYAGEDLTERVHLFSW